MKHEHHTVALVTGASSGIGAAYARGLGARGYDLVLLARRADRLRALADEIHSEHGSVVECVPADLATHEGLALACAAASKEHVGVVINNAGIGAYGSFAESQVDLVSRLVQLNVLGPTLIARAALPGMLRRRSGCLVNVGSMLAFSGGMPTGQQPGRATYAASKSYILTLTRALALEVEGSGVQVQVCCPGRTATEFHVSDGRNPVLPGTPAPEADVPTMEAADVVAASLAALSNGEIVCMPGVEDASAFDVFAHAERELRARAAPALAARYR